MYTDVIWHTEIKYVSETKYLKYQQNIEGNSILLECENAKIF